jgi:hypothetical protein
LSTRFSGVSSMSYLKTKKILVAGLFGSLLLIGSAQAATNPFSEARPDSRLPTIAQQDSGKCAGMGATSEEKGSDVQCGAGKCGASMGDSAKPDAEPMQGDKCGGSGSPMPAGQCGGGGKCGGGN